LILIQRSNRPLALPHNACRVIVTGREIIDSDPPGQQKDECDQPPKNLKNTIAKVNKSAATTASLHSDRNIVRQPSCLISWIHSGRSGTFAALVGMQGSNGDLGMRAILAMPRRMRISGEQIGARLRELHIGSAVVQHQPAALDRQLEAGAIFKVGRMRGDERGRTCCWLWSPIEALALCSKQNCAAWPTDCPPGPMSALGGSGRAAPRGSPGRADIDPFARCAARASACCPRNRNGRPKGLAVR
jgi:hypothetical protein